MENEAGFEALSYFLLVHVYICLQVLLTRNPPINLLGHWIVEFCLIAYPCYNIMVTCRDIMSVNDDPVVILGSICVTTAIVKSSIPERLTTLLFHENILWAMFTLIPREYVLGVSLIMVSGQESRIRAVIVTISFSLIWFLSYVKGAGLRYSIGVRMALGAFLVYCFWDSGFTLDLGTVIFTELFLVPEYLPLLGINILTQCGMTLLYNDITSMDPVTQNLPLWTLNQQIRMELDALARPRHTFGEEYV